MKIPRASIWPTVSFDTTSVGGMANARAWVASLLDDEPAGRNVRVVQRTTGDTSDSAPSSPESDAEPAEAPTDHPNPETAPEGRTDDRAIYGPKHGDRWTVRDGKVVVVGSNDWPPPKPVPHLTTITDEQFAYADTPQEADT